MIPAAVALARVALCVAEGILWWLRPLLPLPAILLCAPLRRANHHRYPRVIRGAAGLDGQWPSGRG